MSFAMSDPTHEKWKALRYASNVFVAFSRQSWTLAAYCLVILLLASINRASAQTVEWSWVDGYMQETCDVSVPYAISLCGEAANYGNYPGSPAPTYPGGRLGSSSWVDASGNYWLFGGNGFDGNGNYAFLNELWSYSPTTQKWTSVFGNKGAYCFGTTSNQLCGEPATYGTLGTPAAANTPGGRATASSWTDSHGNFWLFGGFGLDTTYHIYYLNDLWEFQPSLKTWTWMGGSSTVTSPDGQPGIYGTQGTPAATNTPGGRYGSATWVDSSGKLWLFGGEGEGQAGTFGHLNDLWVFDPSTLQWTWIDGSSSVGSNQGQPGIYGALGVPAAGNIPNGRSNASYWTDANGNFWLFGGAGYDSAGNYGFFNDLWEFNPITRFWAWMGGSSIVGCNNCGKPAVYGTLGIFASANQPGGRNGSISWTDMAGDLWLFGGQNFSVASGLLNDLWEFKPTLNQWAWMGGTSTPNVPGVYGAQGAFSTSALPGARTEATGWLESNGRFRLFGGEGFDSTNNIRGLNDTWELAAQPAAPVFSEPGGTYTGTQSITLTDLTPGTQIYYTNDGSAPSASSTLYTGPIAVALSGETLRAIAIAPYALPSPVTSATYILNASPSVPVAATPVFTPGSGHSATPQTITLSDSTPGVSIYYTENGTPSSASKLYTGPITISSSTVTLSAIAVGAGYANSAVASATYVTASTNSTLTLTGTDPYALTCSVAGPAITGVSGPTGTVTFTDITTGQTLGTAVLGSSTIARSYLPPVSYATGSEPGGVTYGDFNGDGKPDLAVAQGNTISVFTNNGDGTFQPQVVYAAPYAGGIEIITGDFNGDGKPDLFVSGGLYGAQILLNNGDGTFAAAGVTNFGLRNSVTADVNGDGKLDLIGVNSFGSSVDVVLGRGDGTLGTLNTYVFGSEPQSVAVADFNLDGKPDIAATAGTASLLLGNGDGTFQPQGVLAKGIVTYATYIVAADFNGDGKPDLAFLNSPSLIVLLGNGDGTFQYSPSLTISLPPYSSTPVVADVNGDGIPDIVMLSPSGVIVLVGNGNGTFTVQNNYVVSSSEGGLIVTDLNGDGIADIAVTNASSNTLSVLLGYAASTATATLSNATVNVGSIASHSLQCSYPGDANFASSASPSVNETYPQAATPVFSLLVGNYPAQQTVTITDATARSALYYTTDGSVPTTSSTLYTGPITISSSVKLQAIAVVVGYVNSQVSEATYNIAAAPSISGNAQAVTITDSTPGAVTHYTLDGSTPSTSSTVYSGPIQLSKTATVKAFAAAPGYVNSAVTSALEIVQATPAVTVTPGASSITTAQPLAVTIAVTGSNGTATGSVVLSAGSYTSPATALTNGSASLTIPAGSFLVGPDPITAAYTPDTADAPAYTSAQGTASVSVTAPTPEGFTLAGSGSITVNPGATAGNTAILTLTPAGGFTGTVTLTCAVSSTLATVAYPPGCALAPAALAVTGAAPVSATLTVSTTALTIADDVEHRFFAPAGMVLCALLCFFGLPLRRRSWPVALILLTILTAGLGCGSSPNSSTSPSGTTPGSYSVIVTATSGSITQSATVSLTIN
jgi:N-acetylneuraminic acid mutarotase